MGCPYAASSLVYSPQTTPNPTFLILSGGASHGAWGAGVIEGWPEGQTPAARPNFTVVTGISVGALLATPAFLGSQYDYLITDFFTNTTDGEIYDFKLDFLVSNALQDRGPLRTKIYENVTKEVVLEVADVQDRELYVGTVNLDTSEFCPWNLSTIAKNAKFAQNAADDDTRDCWVNLFRDAIFAASGAPVIAPPVEIDSNACKAGQPPKKMLHADGGVRARVFVGETVKPAIAAGVTPILYVIMNGKLVTHPECVEDSLLPIALRTFEIIDHEALFGSLHALMSRHPGIQLRLSRIPDLYCLRFPGGSFDEDLMTCLYNEGVRWALRQPIQWETSVPETAAGVWPRWIPNPGNTPNPYPCCRPMEQCTCTEDICVPPQGCPAPIP